MLTILILTPGVWGSTPTTTISAGSGANKFGNSVAISVTTTGTLVVGDKGVQKARVRVIGLRW